MSSDGPLPEPEPVPGAAPDDPVPDIGAAPDDTAPDEDGDAALLARCASDLADAIERALGPWVERSVRRMAELWRPGAGAELAGAAGSAAAAAVAEVGPKVRALLAQDVDVQATGPLAIVRTAVAHPTAVLAAAGVPPVPRDEFAARAFPDDPYDLTPGSFRDLDEAVQEPGLRWGAAKAHTVLARRRHEGRR